MQATSVWGQLTFTWQDGLPYPDRTWAMLKLHGLPQAVLEARAGPDGIPCRAYDYICKLWPPHWPYGAYDHICLLRSPLPCWSPTTSTQTARLTAGSVVKAKAQPDGVPYRAYEYICSLWLTPTCWCTRVRNSDWRLTAQYIWIHMFALATASGIPALIQRMVTCAFLMCHLPLEMCS